VVKKYLLILVCEDKILNFLFEHISHLNQLLSYNFVYIIMISYQIYLPVQVCVE